MSLACCDFLSKHLLIVFKEFGLDRIEAKHFPYPGKASSVNGKGAKPLQCSAMLGSWITFVRSKTVARINAIEFKHVSIPRRLSNDRGRRDAGRESISVDDSPLGCSAVWNLASINENEIWEVAKTLKRSLHCEKTSMINIQTVDLFNFGKANRPRNGVLLD